MRHRMMLAVGLIAFASSGVAARADTQTVNSLPFTIQWPTPNPAPPPANGTMISTGANLTLPLFNPTVGYLTRVDLSFNFVTAYGGSISNFSSTTYTGNIVSSTGTNVRFNMAPFGTLWNFNAPVEGGTTSTAVASFRTSFNLTTPNVGHVSPTVTFTSPDDIKHFVGIGNTLNLNAQQFHTMNLRTNPVATNVSVATFQRAFSPRATATYTFNPFNTPTETGGGLRFSLAEGPRVGQGQVEPTPTGTKLRNGVEALSGMPAITESTASSHTFRFDRIDGEMGQAIVFINGLLDGFLEADNTGRAEAIGIIELFTVDGVFLDRIERLVFADSTSHNNSHIAMNVRERFGLTTALTPGQIYELRTELQVTADPRGVGYALADFNNTFEVELSGSPAIPEPITLGLVAAGIALTRPGAGRRPADARRRGGSVDG